MTVSRTEEFFGFSHRPFRCTPDPQDYVPVDSVEQEIERLVASAAQGDGVSVLTAPPGAGKTVVCERLRHDLAHDFKAAVLTSSGFATRRALLQAMLFALGQPYESFSEQELRLGVLNFGRSVATDREGIVLIVDEAHLLNARLLEELRCLTNHSEGGRPLIRVILCGQLSLEDTLVDPALQALNYRITCHSTLEPLSIQESADLIAGRLLHAGRTVGAIFTAEALETICRVSDGNPRCLVQLSDQALTIGARNGEAPVSAESVRLALRDLKQLPLHWNESAVDQPATFDASVAIDDDLGAVLHLEDELDMDLVEESADETLTMEPIGDWSNAVSSVEVGSDLDVDCYNEIMETEADSVDGIDSQDSELKEEDVPLSAAGWSSFESGTPLDEPTIPVAPPTVAKNVKPIVAESHPTGFEELSVDDSYAVLDQSTARTGGLRRASELAAMLNSAVTSANTRRPVEPVDDPFDDLPEAAQALRAPSADPEQRIDEVLAALSLVIDEPADVEDDELSNDEVEWQTAGDSRQFDLVEPYGEPIWDAEADFEEESVYEPTPAPLESTIERPAPATKPRATGTSHERAADREAEASAQERPYARLFSRLRRQRA